MSVRKVDIRYDNTGMVFTDLHRTAAAEYAGAWLCANRGIIDAVSSRVCISDEAVRELLSCAAAGALAELYAAGWLNRVDGPEEGPRV